MRKKVLSLICTAIFIFTFAFSLSGYADFDLDTLKSDKTYIVTEKENGEVTVIYDGDNNYVNAEENSVELRASEGSLETFYDIYRKNEDSPFVMRFRFTYRNNTLINAQQILIICNQNAYTLYPESEILKDSETGKDYEVISVYLTDKEAVRLFREFAADEEPPQITIAGAKNTVFGNITIGEPESIEQMYEDFISAGGLDQEFSENDCSRYEINELLFVEDSQVIAEQDENNGKPRITSNPGSTVLTEGMNATFTSTAENFSYVNWRLVNGNTVVYMNQAPYYFPGLSVYGDGTQQITLSNCPYSLNGWQLEAVFGNSNNDTVSSQKANISVSKAQYVQLVASPSSGYFQSMLNGVRLTAGRNDVIHFEVYRDNALINQGNINSGDTVWLNGNPGAYQNVFLYAYVTTNTSNAVSCQYVIDTRSFIG